MVVFFVFGMDDSTPSTFLGFKKTLGFPLGHNGEAERGKAIPLDGNCEQAL